MTYDPFAPELFDRAYQAADDRRLPTSREYGDHPDFRVTEEWNSDTGLWEQLHSYYGNDPTGQALLLARRKLLLEKGYQDRGFGAVHEKDRAGFRVGPRKATGEPRSGSPRGHQPGS